MGEGELQHFYSKLYIIDYYTISSHGAPQKERLYPPCTPAKQCHTVYKPVEECNTLESVSSLSLCLFSHPFQPIISTLCPNYVSALHTDAPGLNPNALGKAWAYQAVPCETTRINRLLYIYIPFLFSNFLLEINQCGGRKNGGRWCNMRQANHVFPPPRTYEQRCILEESYQWRLNGTYLNSVPT